jgi:acyl-coenzyme A thioesterase PaaI-like protein
VFVLDQLKRFIFDEVEKGIVKAHFVVEDDFCNPGSFMHGGAYATLAGSTFFCFAVSTSQTLD